MKVLYGVTIALSAALLFTVEPLIARTLLPQLGGSSAVWLSSLAFFQLALLLGYGYTSFLTRVLRHRPWLLHLALLFLAAAALFTTSPSHAVSLGTASPQIRIFLLLTLTIGLPFTTLSTTAPLLQAWYAQREQTAVPYRLFGLSNFASLLALLAYPLLIEPHLTLHTQWLLWRLAFLAYLTLTAVLCFRMRSAARPAPEPLQDIPSSPEPTVSSAPSLLPQAAPALPSPPVRRRILLWLLLPASASLQLAAVTSHLTQDIASFPLLWVLPLAVYLL
ncbi:MAG: hypothetical protein INR62_11555, partial [Rhodospirillales bacterium]|nr:hypothetical protein [Acetobacter sp.]